MRRNIWKIANLILLVGLFICAASFTGKDKKKPSLPAKVTAKITSEYPNATIEEFEIEKEGINVYEVELEQGDKDIELELTADGTILGIEDEVDICSLPAPIANAIKEQANGAEIEEVKKEIKYFEIRIVPLKTPEITYEAEVKINGKKKEIEVSANGTVLKADAEDDNNKCNGDDGDDDENEKDEENDKDDK